VPSELANTNRRAHRQAHPRGSCRRTSPVIENNSCQKPLRGYPIKVGERAGKNIRIHISRPEMVTTHSSPFDLVPRNRAARGRRHRRVSATSFQPVWNACQSPAAPPHQWGGTRQGRGTQPFERIGKVRSPGLRAVTMASQIDPPSAHWALDLPLRQRSGAQSSNPRGSAVRAAQPRANPPRAPAQCQRVSPPPPQQNKSPSRAGRSPPRRPAAAISSPCP